MPGHDVYCSEVDKYPSRPKARSSGLGFLALLLDPHHQAARLLNRYNSHAGEASQDSEHADWLLQVAHQLIRDQGFHAQSYDRSNHKVGHTNGSCRQLTLTFRAAHRAAQHGFEDHRLEGAPESSRNKHGHAQKKESCLCQAALKPQRSPEWTCQNQAL